MLIRIISFSLIFLFNSPISGQLDFSFDDFNRIKSATYENGTSISFTYDKLGNRTGYTIVGDGCSKLVTNISNTDFGSLRHNINCAMPGDTIHFASVLQDSEIFLDLPTIEVDKELYLIAPSNYNITLSNQNVSNTEVLMNISDDLYIEGLHLIGKSENSMILKVSPGGSLEFINGDMNKVDVRNED